MLRKGFHHVYQAPEGDSGSGGAPAAGGESAPGGTPAPAPSGAPPAVPAAGTPAPAPAPAAGNALAAGGQPGEGGDLSTKVHERFHVKAADGTLDLQATLAKQADSYSQLEARMRDTGAPPQKPEEYQVTVPEEVKGKWDPDKDPMLQDFRGKALAAGLTQKQFDMVMGEYLARIPGIQQQAAEQQFEGCMGELGKHWATPAAMKTGQRNAWRAVTGLMGGEADAFMARHGNDPMVVRFAAAIGAEMAEDRSPGAGGNGGGDGMAAYTGMTRDQLMQHEAYKNAQHVDHKRVSDRVRSLYEREFGNAPAM